MQGKPKPKKISTKIAKRRTSNKAKSPGIALESTPRSGKTLNSPLSAKVARKIKKAKTGAESKIETSSDEDDSIDSINFKKQTIDVKAEVLKSLQLFKAASQEYIDQNKILEKEVDDFEMEFEQVRTEVSEIVNESNRSKLELNVIKKRYLLTPELVEETIEKCTENRDIFQEESLDLEVPRSEGKDVLLLKKVEEIRNEVKGIKVQLEANEEGIKETEEENTEFRNITFKLKENLSSDPLRLEFNDEKVVCKSCLIY